MKILNKKLGPAEVKCRCIIIPADNRTSFPAPGVKFDLFEGKVTHQARLDSQFRLRAPSWFRQHSAVKAGDEVTFLKENGTTRISLSRFFPKPENEAIGWGHEVLDAIKGGEIYGVITLSGNGFSVEIGEHVKETKIIFKAK